MNFIFITRKEIIMADYDPAVLRRLQLTILEILKDIDSICKENNIEYSIHGVGGCTCCGLELRQDGKSYPTDKILEIINGSLKNHWIYVQENKNQPGFLTVHSKFDKKP